MDWRRFFPTAARWGLLPIFLTGCPGPTEVDTGPDEDVLFLVRRSLPDTGMEALYEGRVEIDQAGCLRLAGDPDRHTVVWPFGSRLARDKVSLVVLDREGREVLRVGHLTRLGGGEVPDVPGTEVLTPEMAEAARIRCPGRFWIVGTFVGSESAVADLVFGGMTVR